MGRCVETSATRFSGTSLATCRSSFVRLCYKKVPFVRWGLSGVTRYCRTRGGMAGRGCVFACADRQHQRQGRGRRGRGHHTICSKLHAKPFDSLKLPFRKRRYAKGSIRAEKQGFFLSKSCFRIDFKGNWFEKVQAEGGIGRYFPNLFSRWAASVQF